MNNDTDEELIEPLSQRQIDMQIVRRAVELALPLVAEVGHTFTHDWLAKALELPEPTTIAEYKKSEMRRMALVITWCDVLLAEHGIHIENSRSKGYTVIDPKLTTQVVTASVKRESDKYSRKHSISSL